MVKTLRWTPTPEGDTRDTLKAVGEGRAREIAEFEGLDAADGRASL